MSFLLAFSLCMNGSGLGPEATVIPCMEAFAYKEDEGMSKNKRVEEEEEAKALAQELRERERERERERDHATRATQE